MLRYTIQCIALLNLRLQARTCYSYTRLLIVPSDCPAQSLPFSLTATDSINSLSPLKSTSSASGEATGLRADSTAATGLSAYYAAETDLKVRCWVSGNRHRTGACTHVRLPNGDLARVLSARSDPHDESVEHQGDKADLNEQAIHGISRDGLDHIFKGRTYHGNEVRRMGVDIVGHYARHGWPCTTTSDTAGAQDGQIQRTFSRTIHRSETYAEIKPDPNLT